MRTWSFSLARGCLVGAVVLFGCQDDATGPGGGSDDASSGGGLGTASGGNPGAGGQQGVTGGATASGGSGGSAVVQCENQNPTLSVERLTTVSIAEMGTPFDTNGSDVEGPDHWAMQYGKSPETVPYASGDTLDVLFQDQDSDDFAYVVHVARDGQSYAVQDAYRVASLGRIMGLTKDTEGNYYVATGVDEDDQVDATYPPNDIHRPDVVRIVKFDEWGCVLMESDVDIERGNANPESEIIVNPMTAATSRLVWGGDRLLLVHGHNTEPDSSIGGTRHQKALSTHINSLDGTVTRSSTMWVSHSFDQRALYDGDGFVEMHLGDAYPRFVALGRYDDSGGDGPYPVYRIKGAEGANNTYTRLGGIVPTSDPTYGYLALFATERSTTAGDDLISGTRDVALVRIRSDFAQSDTDEPIVESGNGVSSHTVNSAGETVTNSLRWLTDLGAGTHAERPKITNLGNDELVVLFERWSDDGDDYDGTFSLLIDSSGSVLAGPTEVPGQHHLQRGDDIATLDGRAVYVTGGPSGLHLNLIDGELNAERITLP